MRFNMFVLPAFLAKRGRRDRLEKSSNNHDSDFWIKLTYWWEMVGSLYADIQVMGMMMDSIIETGVAIVNFFRGDGKKSSQLAYQAMKNIKIRGIGVTGWGLVLGGMLGTISAIFSTRAHQIVNRRLKNKKKDEELSDVETEKEKDQIKIKSKDVKRTFGDDGILFGEFLAHLVEYSLPWVDLIDLDELIGETPEWWVILLKTAYEAVIFTVSGFAVYSNVRSTNTAILDLRLEEAKEKALKNKEKEAAKDSVDIGSSAKVVSTLRTAEAPLLNLATIPSYGAGDGPDGIVEDSYSLGGHYGLPEEGASYDESHAQPQRSRRPGCTIQ